MVSNDNHALILSAIRIGGFSIFLFLVLCFSFLLFFHFHIFLAHGTLPEALTLDLVNMNPFFSPNQKLELNSRMKQIYLTTDSLCWTGTHLKGYEGWILLLLLQALLYLFLIIIFTNNASVISTKFAYLILFLLL